MKISIFPVFLVLLLASCNVEIPNDVILERKNIKIYPDYANLTIPYNIAPLNFEIDEDSDSYLTKIYSKKGPGIFIKGKDVLISENKWKELLFENKGDTIYFQIFLQRGNEWIKFPTIKNYIAIEPIDNFLAYRLIQPLVVELIFYGK